MSPREDDARPAAVAGRAGEDDVYLLAARAYRAAYPSAHPDDDLTEVAAFHWIRIVVDAVRAPLLAELAEASALLADVDGDPTELAKLYDQARAELAEVTRQRDEARRSEAHAKGSAGALGAELIESHIRIKARDEVIEDLRAELEKARAKAVDGGEHPCLPLIVIAEAFGGGLEVRCGNCGTYEPIGSGGEMDLAELRAWLDGHCEPVTDDGGTDG